MDNNKIVDDATNKLKQALIHFEDDLTKIRTGRANAAILDGLVVEAYQTQMQLKQLATVIAP